MLVHGLDLSHGEHQPVGQGKQTLHGLVQLLLGNREFLRRKQVLGLGCWMLQGWGVLWSCCRWGVMR